MKLQVIQTDKGWVAISDEKSNKGDTAYVPDTSLCLGFLGKCGLDKQEQEKATKEAGFKFYKVIATDTSFKLEGIPQFELEVEPKKPVAIEVETNNPYFDTEYQEMRERNKSEIKPTIVSSEEYPDGLLTIKQYYYE